MDFFRSLSSLKGDIEFGITTNGTLLSKKIDRLVDYGIRKINISLDTLNQNNFSRITGSDSLGKVLRSIDLAIRPDILLKVNCVVMRGINDQEIPDFVKFAIEKNLNVRFIEFMPFSNNRWASEAFIPYKEMIDLINKEFKLISRSNIARQNTTWFPGLAGYELQTSSSSRDYAIEHQKGLISFITPISDHFCLNCNRLRLTADGRLKTCLFSTVKEIINIKQYLNKSGVLGDNKSGTEKIDSDDLIIEAVRSALMLKELVHPPLEKLREFEGNKMLRIGG
jgi:GTP 3',8-cyclase